jgi:hypothetical protein
MDGADEQSKRIKSEKLKIRSFKNVLPSGTFSFWIISWYLRLDIFFGKIYFHYSIAGLLDTQRRKGWN